MLQRVEGSIEIDAPVERVYGYWETLENLPQFTSNVQGARHAVRLLEEAGFAALGVPGRGSGGNPASAVETSFRVRRWNPATGNIGQTSLMERSFDFDSVLGTFLHLHVAAGEEGAARPNPTKAGKRILHGCCTF